MLQSLRILPRPLQTQFLIRAGLMLLCIVLALILTVWCQDFRLGLPFSLLSAVLAVSAGCLLHIALSDRYLILHGVVQKVERTPLRRYTAAVLLVIDSNTLRIQLRNRHLRVDEGDSATVFIADTAQVFPWHEIYQLSAYLALSIQCSQEGAHK